MQLMKSTSRLMARCLVVSLRALSYISSISSDFDSSIDMVLMIFRYALIDMFRRCIPRDRWVQPLLNARLLLMFCRTCSLVMTLAVSLASLEPRACLVRRVMSSGCSIGADVVSTSGDIVSIILFTSGDAENTSLYINVNVTSDFSVWVAILSMVLNTLELDEVIVSILFAGMWCFSMRFSCFEARFISPRALHKVTS